MRVLKEAEVFPWQRFGNKLKEKIAFPKNMGTLSDDGLSDRYLMVGEDQDLEEGYTLKLFIFFDREDHLIADAKFQIYGPTLLVGAAEVLCDLLIRKNVYQAKKITAELIEDEMLLGSKYPLPQESADYINVALSTLDNALENLPEDLASGVERVTPINLETNDKTNLYPDFLHLPKKEKLRVIQEVIDRDIAPYIALDDGGVEVLDINELEIILKYSGACTSCYSAIGSTLSAIEKTLRDQIYPELNVVPDMDSLNF